MTTYFSHLPDFHGPETTDEDWGPVSDRVNLLPISPESCPVEVEGGPDRGDSFLKMYLQI